MEPGIYRDIPAETYHSGPEISVSGLKRFAEAPAKYRYGKPLRSPALTRGTAVHTAILEPAAFDANYYPSDLKTFDQRHKAYQEEEARAAGRQLIKRADYEQVRRMQDAVYAHPAAQELLEAAGLTIEQSLFWRDPDTGVACRGRTDAYRPADCLIADVKTTADASPEAFGRSCHEWKYHWQDVFYTGALELLTGKPHTLLFVAVETEPPYLVAVHAVAEEARRLAVAEVTLLLERYAECLRTDTWPGYPEGINEVSLPAWAMRAA